MKKLKELYPEVESDISIRGIKINSKEVVTGDLFVCTMGVTADRHEFIEDAKEHGAAAIVVSKDVADLGIPIIKVSDTNRELPYLCQKFNDYPDRDLKIIGVTGTDGKTSVSVIVQTLLGSDLCGYIGTNGVNCKGFSKSEVNTTPDAPNLYSYLKEFVSRKCQYVSMETSSEAFFRGRLQAMSFDVSVFTNITPEHLNIHGSFENYLQSKLMLLKQTKKTGFCILNRDEEHYDVVRTACNGKILTYGFHKDCDMRIVEYQLGSKNTSIVFQYLGKEYRINSPLLALYNVYNLAAAMLACLALGKSMEDIICNISKLHIDGRMEVLDTGDLYSVIVDFAHTPSAIENILKFTHSIEHDRIITVIGSAGRRDKLKRPLIGNVCDKYSDYTIFTTDDPRDEDPMDICKMMIENLKDEAKYEIILDRSSAVFKAISMAKNHDIVLLLCKGNEPYQITVNGYEYYNEVEEAEKAIRAKKERS